MITKLDQLIDAVQKKGKKRIAVAYAECPKTIRAVADAQKLGIVDPILIGERANIYRAAAEAGVDLSSFVIQEELSDLACVARAVQMVHHREADVLMKGLVSTDKYMRGILNKETGIVPPKATLSHVSVLEIPAYHKLLLVSDVAVLVRPNLSQKVQLVQYLRDTAHALGIANPKIAVLSATEQVLPNIDSSYDGAVISKMWNRGQIEGCTVDGPLALDVAIDSNAVRTKKLDSSVEGDADALIFPSLEAGNIFFKSATKLMKAKVAGMVVGTQVPCVLTSRDDSKESKLYSVALAALSAK